MSDRDAAVAAIKFALSADEGQEFLRCWVFGDFDSLRREWPDAPESVFTGADPTGSGWRDDEVEGFRTYHRYTEVPKSQWCWGMHCPTPAGGCGAEIHGDSKEEALSKWNRRA